MEAARGQSAGGGAPCSAAQMMIALPYDWGAARYEVWRSAAGATKTKLGVTRLTRLVDRSATAGKTYTYPVRALNCSGRTGFSKTAVSCRN